MNEMRLGAFRRDREFWPYLLLLALCAGLYLPVIFAGRTTLLPSYQDLTQWRIYREFVSVCLAQGYFPLWCPGLFSGMDFAGWGHSSAFYPPAFFFFVFDFARAAVWNQFLHAALALTGFYYLGRRMGLEKFPALAAAGGFGFAFFVPSSVQDFLPDIFALAFIPWIYASSLELARFRRIRDFLALSALAGVQVLSGHMEVAALQYLSLFIFLAVYLALSGAAARAKLSGIFLWLVAVAFGGMLGVISALPSLSAYGQSFRRMPFSYGLFTLFPGQTLYLESAAVLAMFASLLLVLALGLSFRKRDAIFWGLLVMMIFTLAETFNWLNVLWVFYRLPVFSGFIPHGRGLVNAVIALFLLMGFGLQRMDTFSGKKSGALVPALILTEAAFLCGLYLLTRRYSGSIPPEFSLVFSRFLASRLALSAALAFAGALAAGFGLAKARLNAKFWLGAALALEFIVTGFFVLPRNNPELLKENADYLQFLKKDYSPDYRVQSVYSYDQWEKLSSPLQTGVSHGTRSPDAYVTFAPLRYTEFVNLLDKKAFQTEQGRISDVQVPNILKRGDFVSREKLPLINLLNLKYLVGQNKNLKAATSFFLGYELRRFDPRTSVAAGRSFKELALEPPSRFGLLLYVQSGDRLVVELRNDQTPGAQLVFQLWFGGEGGEEELVLEKVMAGDETASFSLEKISGRTGRLILCFTPLSGAGAPGWRLYARIENPGKFFRRLDYADIDVFENRSALPRAFLVRGVKVIPGREERLGYLGSDDFDPARTAVVEKNLWLPLPEKMAPSPGEGVRVVSADAVSGGMSLLARNFSPAVLVFSESWYPGFRAFLDQRETRIFPADHAFRGVLLDSPGVHKLEMKYQPASFAVALWAGISGVAVWLFACALSLRAVQKGRSRRAAGPRAQ